MSTNERARNTRTTAVNAVKTTHEIVEAILPKQPKRLTPEEVQRILTTPPLILTLREAAAYIRCSERKVRAEAKARLLPSIKFRGKLLFRRAELDQALARLETRAVV